MSLYRPSGSFLTLMVGESFSSSSENAPIALQTVNRSFWSSCLTAGFSFDSNGWSELVDEWVDEKLGIIGFSSGLWGGVAIVVFWRNWEAILRTELELGHFLFAKTWWRTIENALKDTRMNTITFSRENRGASVKLNDTRAPQQKPSCRNLATVTS